MNNTNLIWKFMLKKKPEDLLVDQDHTVNQLIRFTSTTQINGLNF